MQIFFSLGAVAGWLLVSLFYGKLLPAFSIPTFIAVSVGGIVGVVAGCVWSEVSRGSPKDSNKDQKNNNS